MAIADDSILSRLSINQLINLPESIGELSNLAELDLSSNKIVNLETNSLQSTRNYTKVKEKNENH